MTRVCPVILDVREELDAICTSDESAQPQPSPLCDSVARFSHVRAYVRYLLMWECEDVFVSPGLLSPLTWRGPVATAPCVPTSQGVPSLPPEPSTVYGGV